MVHNNYVRIIEIEHRATSIGLLSYSVAELSGRTQILINHSHNLKFLTPLLLHSKENAHHIVDSLPGFSQDRVHYLSLQKHECFHDMVHNLAYASHVHQYYNNILTKHESDHEVDFGVTS